MMIDRFLRKDSRFSSGVAAKPLERAEVGVTSGPSVKTSFSIV
jgi:hypothetical protein